MILRSLKVFATASVLVHLFSFQLSIAADSERNPLQNESKFCPYQQELPKKENSSVLDRVPVVKNYRNFLRQDSLVFGRHVCRGLSIGVGSLVAACFLGLTKREILYRSELVGIMLFFGASTVYISPRTNPLLKHGLTTAGATAGTAAVMLWGQWE